MFKQEKKQTIIEFAPEKWLSTSILVIYTKNNKNYHNNNYNKKGEGSDNITTLTAQNLIIDLELYPDLSWFSVGSLSALHLVVSSAFQKSFSHHISFFHQKI